MSLETEVWRTVPDHPNYEVSSLGRVLSHAGRQPRGREVLPRLRQCALRRAEGR